MSLFSRAAGAVESLVLPSDVRITAVPDLPPEPPDGCAPVLALSMPTSPTPLVRTDPYLRMLYRQKLSTHICFSHWSPNDATCTSCPAQLECVEAVSERLTGEDKLAAKEVVIARKQAANANTPHAPGVKTSWANYKGPYTEEILDRGLYTPMEECGVPLQLSAFPNNKYAPTPAYRLFKAQQDYLKRHDITLKGRGDWFEPVAEYFAAGPEACETQAQVIEES